MRAVKVAESIKTSQIGLAEAKEYWRRGETSEAMAIIETVLERPLDAHARCETVIYKAICLCDQAKYGEALQSLTGIDIDAVSDPTLKGQFFGQRAHALAGLGKIDEALIDHEGADYWFEQGGNLTFQAAVKTNLARWHSHAGNHVKAHSYIAVARSIYVGLNDNDRLAKTCDQQARIYLREGLLPAAEQVARTAVGLLERGERKAWLAEARSTLGTVLARQGKYPMAKDEFTLAIRLCDSVGATGPASLVCLRMIEELDLGLQELIANYLRADSYPDRKRVVTARRKLAHALSESAEVEEVKLALQKHGGAIKKASVELGLKSHGWLLCLIEKHPELSSYRKPKRKKSIIRK